jgi:hypothetical protein
VLVLLVLVLVLVLLLLLERLTSKSFDWNASRPASIASLQRLN